MLNYRDCAGQNGCRTGEPGRGYFREAYSCTATQYTTTACPPSTTGGGAGWSRPLTATLTTGGTPSLSDPPWTWSSTSCARTERQTLSCPAITQTVDYGTAGTPIGGSVNAISGAITQERTFTVHGSGPAPAPGGTNASPFSETGTDWATVSDTCVYPTPPDPPLTGGTGNEGGSCFVAETLVRLADGRAIPIADVEVGDVVRGDSGPNTVRGLYRTKLFGRLLYAINGGRHFVTGEHPFRAVDGWCAIDPDLLAEEDPQLAAELAPRTMVVGDVLVTEDGPLTVTSIDGAPGPHDLPLYNLILDGDHTFVADGFLIHNGGCDGDSGHGTGEGDGSSCFITTAVVTRTGEADDGPTLSAMRALRDRFVAPAADGQSRIDLYYAVAPAIVARINTRPDADAVYRAIHDRWIAPGVAAMQAGHPDEAARLYRRMMAQLMLDHLLLPDAPPQRAVLNTIAQVLRGRPLAPDGSENQKAIALLRAGIARRRAA